MILIVWLLAGLIVKSKSKLLQIVTFLEFGTWINFKSLWFKAGTWGAKGKLEMWGDIMDKKDIDLKLQATKLLMKILGVITTRLQL
jgi:hypothetical protein